VVLSGAGSDVVTEHALHVVLKYDSTSVDYSGSRSENVVVDAAKSHNHARLLDQAQEVRQLGVGKIEW